MSTCNNCGQPIKNTNLDIDTRSLCIPCIGLLERTKPIRITPIKDEDLELTLAWRSNPKIYQYFRGQNGPLSWEDHLSWYKSRESDRHDFIIHYRNRRVGVVSITVTDEISIYLGDFSAQGEGVATATLRWVCKRFKTRAPLTAEIHENNTPSKRLFEGCGFQQCGCDDEWMIYNYEL